MNKIKKFSAVILLTIFSLSSNATADLIPDCKVKVICEWKTK